MVGSGKPGLATVVIAAQYRIVRRKRSTAAASVLWLCWQETCATTETSPAEGSANGRDEDSPRQDGRCSSSRCRVRACVPA